MYNHVLNVVKKIISRMTSSIRNSDISPKAQVSYFVRFHNSSIGKYSYVSNDCNIFHTSIGNFVSIGSGCAFGGADHPIHWVSTSPAFHKHPVFPKSFSTNEYRLFKQTTIGNDVWIATNSIIKAGVTVSDGAVIGAGSVVTKDVPPYEIWAGNPAHFIKKRFSDDVISKLLETEWWNWDDEKIQKYAQYFNSPDEFLEKLNQDK